MLPTLRQLQYLKLLSEHGSFSRAAEAAHVSQPALSSGVQELERVLGAPVVERTRGNVQLTAVGAEACRRAEDVLTKPDFARLETELKTRKMPVAMANALKPVFLTMLFAEPACVSLSRVGNSFVDLLVARTARAAGKPVVGLETIGEQLSVLASFPGSMQGPYLKASVALLDRQEDMYETMLRLYVEGEFGWMTAWSRGSRLVPKVDAAMPALFYERLLDMRNVTMRDRALPLLAQGGVFIGVGAAHLPGRLGLANLIREAGYTVERVE
jgi:molybdate transport repressor ModE-like protein